MVRGVKSLDLEPVGTSAWGDIFECKLRGSLVVMTSESFRKFRGETSMIAFDSRRGVFTKKKENR